MVRQFRYAVGEALLEIPAGTREPGEAPLACAVGELGEGVGAHAAHWEPLAALYPSPGVMTEVMHLFLATGLTEGPAYTAGDENLVVERVPLRAAGERGRQVGIRDAKSLSRL